MISQSLSTQQNCVLEAFGLHEFAQDVKFLACFLLVGACLRLKRGYNHFHPPHVP